MDLRPLLRPRHLTLTVLVGLLAGATIAAAGAGPDADVPAALASPVTFPGRAVGDRGMYSTWDRAVDTRADPSTWGEPDRTFAFEWGADQRHLDNLGRLVTVNVLHVQEAYTVDGETIVRNETLWLRAGTGQLLATVHPDARSVVQDGGGFLPTSTVDTSMAGLAILYRDQPPATRSSEQEGVAGDALSGKPCLFLPTQGRTVPLDGASIDGFGGCWWLTSGFGQARVRIQAVGGEPGSREVLLAASVPDILGWGLVGHLWLREGIAYPIRMEQVSDGAIDGVVLLTRLTVGGQALATSEDAAPLVPALDMAPRQAWGPDETGVVHPFPLSTALREAQAQDADIARLFEMHADAYVAWATYAAFDTAGVDDQRWTFGATDGTTVLARAVLQRSPKALTQGGVSAALGAGDGPTITVEPSDWTPYGGEFVPLPPSEVPDRLPTVASMQRSWQGYNGDLGSADVVANAWGFYLAQDDGPGGYPAQELWAGHIGYTESAQAPTALGAVGPRTTTWLTSEARWRSDSEGITMFSQGNSSSQYQEATLPLAGVDGAPPEPAFTGGTEANAINANDARFEWTPIERAAIGIGALLLAGLYWIAPALKNGVVGLFSRIRDDDLLENPSRRLLRDLVEQTPGIHHQELVRRLGKGKGGAEHHLRKLVEGGVLVSRSSPGYTCYWVPGQATKVAVAAAPMLKSPIAQGIVRLRMQQPGISNAELARALGVRPATISYHVDRLRAAGVLTATGHAMPGFVDGQEDSAAAA